MYLLKASMVHYEASNFANSPVSFSFLTSVPPPTNRPFTNTRGTFEIHRKTHKWCSGNKTKRFFLPILLQSIPPMPLGYRYNHRDYLIRLPWTFASTYRIAAKTKSIIASISPSPWTWKDKIFGCSHLFRHGAIWAMSFRKDHHFIAGDCIVHKFSGHCCWYSARWTEYCSHTTYLRCSDTAQ